VVNYIHATAPACKVGGMIAYQLFYPATCKPEDVFFAYQADERLNQLYWEVFTNGKYTKNMLAYFSAANCEPEMAEADLVILAKSKSDFLSFSYYASKCMSFAAVDTSKPFFRQVEQAHVANSNLVANAWNWEIDPLGFRLILDKTYQQYKLPLFPIENGIGWDEVWDGTQTIDDSYRIDYHRSHIQAMQQAMEIDGVDVLGYLTWAPIDILSSQGEMKKRYGFVYVNRDEHDLKDLSRIPKRSFVWMKKVTASNGVDLE
jgi:6-phospho-beta-glucosidase